MRTDMAIASRDSAGKQFSGRLAGDVTLEGKVLLRAGTKLLAVVDSRRVAVATVSRPLTLKLTQVFVNGHPVPVKSEGFEATAKAWKGRRGVTVSGSAFVLPPGTTFPFRLAQPLNL